ncbi:flippase-like domain-containing protein [Candidatus Saccharibacteria bacterium]|nr:MAG: flippase-like domain-containing protein [Candidatus Saccharibacteria bacterium]
MAETSFMRRNWKVLLNVVTVIALVVLVVAIRDQFKATFENLFKVHIWVLLLIPVIQALNYDAQTRLYQDLFAIVGNKLRYKELYKSALALNYVNTVFPSGGVSGISYFGARMKGTDITGPKASAVQLFKLILYFLSFEGLIMVGVFALALQGQMNSLVLLLAGTISTVVVIATAAMGFIISSKRRISGFFAYMSVLLNRIIRVVRPKHKETIKIDRVRRVFDDLHENYMLMTRDLRKLKRPLFFAMLASFWEVLTIYVVYVAFGEWVNIGAVILAYAIANFAGLISVLPGGIGVYEGLMTLTLTATGIPSRLSLPVTIMYRILAISVQLIPGAYFYHEHLGQKEPPTIEVKTD